MKSFPLIATLACALIGVTAQAQSQMKVGYADVDFILSKMPETALMQTELQQFGQNLQREYETSLRQFQQSAQAYRRDQATMSEEQRKEKEQLLANAQQALNESQQRAQRSVQLKSAELLRPIYAKLGDNIKAVAEENGFTHVLNGNANGADIVLYASDQYDVTDLVLRRMGVPPVTQ